MMGSTVWWLSGDEVDLGPKVGVEESPSEIAWARTWIDALYCTLDSLGVALDPLDSRILHKLLTGVLSGSCRMCCPTVSGTALSGGAPAWGPGKGGPTQSVQTSLP